MANPGYFATRCKVEVSVLVRVNSEKCTLCMLCVECCPAHVFVIENGSIKADSSKCIECYGCVLLCPVQAIAIEISGGTLANFISKNSAKRTKSQKSTNFSAEYFEDLDVQPGG